MPQTYRVTIYRRNIAGIFRTNGEGGRWIYRVSVAMMREARKGAPARTGSLRDAHRISRDHGANQYAATFNVSNVAEHAEWVHGGTAGKGTGYIYPKQEVNSDGNYSRLVIPAGNGYRKISALKVKGQKPNPWLDEACARIAIRYGAVPIA